MRTLSLIFHRMKQHLRYSTLLIILFLAGCFICSIATIILYGNTMPHMTHDTIEKLYRTYDVFLYHPISVQQLNITETMSKQNFGCPIENIILNSYIEELEMDIKASTVDRIYEDYISDAKFSADPLSKEMILSEFSFDFKLLEQYSIFEETYDVVGYSSYNYIRYSEFFRQDLKVDRITIVFEKPLTAEQSQSCMATLKNMYPDSPIRDPRIYFEQDKTMSVYSAILLAVLYAFMFFSLTFLLYYVFRSELHENVIFMLHGASAKRMFSMILGEQLIWVTLSGILSSCVHCLFYRPFFETFNIYANVRFAFLDYLIVIGVIDLVSLICLLPFVKIIFSRYSNQLRQEAKDL